MPKDIKVGKILRYHEMSKMSKEEFHELYKQSKVVPFEQTEFYKHYEHILSKKEIPEQSLNCIILDYLLGFDRDSGGTVDKAREDNYKLFEEIRKRYPKTITVARNKQDKEYLEDMSNYGVAGV